MIRKAGHQEDTWEKGAGALGETGVCRAAGNMWALWRVTGDEAESMP